MNKSKIFYCFVGQNASTGTAHPQTGCYSQYGNIIAFSSIKKRDKFVAEYHNQDNSSEYAEKCNKSTARNYCLGWSMYVFDQYMDDVLSLIDEEYNSFFQISGFDQLAEACQGL